jgi:hypothetical protein
MMSFDDNASIKSGAFKMEENIRLFVGSPATAVSTQDKGKPSVHHPTHESICMEYAVWDSVNLSLYVHIVLGDLIGPFAKMGKCKIRFPSGTSAAVGASVHIELPI